jgi:type II secretory pathway pseudopilin PulG
VITRRTSDGATAAGISEPAATSHRERTRRLGFGVLRGEGGFTLIEALSAMVLFILVAAALATLLGSAIRSQGQSRERTVAQETAMREIERVRGIAYDEVGLVSGNPPGVLVANQSETIGGVKITIVTQVAYVDDPTPTSYATEANYKKVTVSVYRQSDNKLLTREVTYVAPPARDPLGGINNAIVNVQVIDFALNTPVEGATVALATGPSAPRSDTTDNTGGVTFPALDYNPTTGPTAYYDISASLSGYVMYGADQTPAAAAHVQLAPGQTFNTVLRVYKPASLVVALDNADGSTYAGTATVTVASVLGAEDFAYSGSALTIDTIDGEEVVPSLEYTVSATTAFGLAIDPVTKYVPDDYPPDLTSDVTLTLPPAGSIKA